MRIGLIAPPWLPVPPPAYGGTEAVVDRLARGFRDLGHDVLLWTTGDSTCDVPSAWVLPESRPDRMGMATIEMRHLIHGYETMKALQCDIVHDHTNLGPVYAHRFPELNVVTTNHGPFDEDLNDLYEAVSSHVPIIAISYEQARRAGLLPVAAVIHHGVDPENFPVGDGQGDDDGEYFLFLGRMAPEKGARQAIRAARQAGVRLKIAAKMREPWEQEFFRQEIEPQLSDDVVYLGEVGGAEKLDLIGRATAMLNPIRWAEPFGLVMIESLACGTPVIAFEEGSVPEIVEHGHTGFVVTGVDDMTTHIDKVHLIDRADCRASVENHFSTARMAADHIEFYEELLEAR